VGTLSGFVPWLVYWVLVGNVPSAAAAGVALVMAVAALAAGRVNGGAARPLEIGAIGTFSVLTALSAVPSGGFVGRWALTLSIVGVLGVAVVAALTGRSLTGAPVEAGPGVDETRTELLGDMNRQVTRVWAVALAVMAISSAIPPIVQSDSAIGGAPTVVSIVFGWVVPFVAFSVAGLASRVLEDRVAARLANPETVRRTTFVAFRELAIDELYYLAREKAEREVGAGMEAYDVKLGGSGVSLTGDESRESWPATYKVRARH
jgi:hypothetical protein